MDEQLKQRLREMGHVFWGDFDLTHLNSRQLEIYKSVIDGLSTWKGEHSAMLLSVPTQGQTGYGVGKTMMMKAMYSRFNRYYLAEGMDDCLTRINPCPFVTASEMLSQLNDEPIADIYPVSPLAVFVDDIGREADRALQYVGANRKDIQATALWGELINWAWVNHVPLVMSANMTMAELQGFIGGASWDRLLEMCCNNWFVVLSGFPSYRVQRVREQGA